MMLMNNMIDDKNDTLQGSNNLDVIQVTALLEYLDILHALLV